RLLALSEGGLGPLDVADDARRIAGLGGDELDGMLAAFGLGALRLHLVEPRGLSIFGKKRAMHAGEDGHGGILTRRCRGAGEGLRERADQIQDRQVAGHFSKLLMRREEMEPLMASSVSVMV